MTKCTRLINHAVFSFIEKNKICPAYHSGMHIVSKGGMCKCGRRFLIGEDIEEENTSANETKA